MTEVATTPVIEDVGERTPEIDARLEQMKKALSGDEVGPTIGAPFVLFCDSLCFSLCQSTAEFANLGDRFALLAILGLLVVHAHVILGLPL